MMWGPGMRGHRGAVVRSAICTGTGGRAGYPSNNPLAVRRTEPAKRPSSEPAARANILSRAVVLQDCRFRVYRSVSPA